MRRAILLTSTLLLGAIAAAPALRVQEAENPVVHTSSHQVPWERVDSLRTLWGMYPEWLPKAQELGHILDRQLWVHLMADEWNVVITRTYRSWDAWANSEPGWAQAVFREVEPDSVRRAAFNEGVNWVFANTIHRDNIYQQVK
ncbi:MAG: hypothetical protein GTO22_21485 [Gemmatimonadales bacterium]|nr:hypothetical protein [Gemmatimonadales bacterium]